MLSFGLSMIISSIIGSAYPLYRSFKALESPETDDDKQWLTYWCVYAAFTLVETFATYFIGWIPLYYEGKIVFILWLVSPQTRGAAQLYDKLLKPHMEKYARHLEPLARQADNLVGYVPMKYVQSNVEAYAPQLGQQVYDYSTKQYSAVKDKLGKKRTE